MTDPATRDSERESHVHPFARAWVLSTAVVVGLAHLVVGAGGGYWFDEAYMLAIGRGHLDWGSADQPPVAPLLAALTDWIAPGSLLALRVPAILGTAAAVIVAAAIARELGGDRRAQVLTAAAQATALWTTFAGHWLTPYTLEPVQWLSLTWALVRWLRVRDDRLLPLVGLIAGIAAETKFQVLLLCAVLVLTVGTVGPRDLLTRPLLWAGAALAALIAAPTLVWQATHDWPQLRMGPIVASEAQTLYGGRPGIAVTLLITPGVLGTALSLYGLWRLWRAEELRAYRFLAWTFVVLYVFFVATAGRPYYLGGLYGVLAAAGALGLQRRREAGGRRWRWVAWPAVGLSVAVAGGLLAVSWDAADQSDRMGTEIVRRTAAAYHALPAAERQRTAILGQSYISAAYLDSYATEYGLPAAHSTNRGYGYFPPPAEHQDRVLYVGSTPDELRHHFANVRPLSSGDGQTSVWLCTGRAESWASLWPKLRHLSVS